MSAKAVILLATLKKTEQSNTELLSNFFAGSVIYIPIAKPEIELFVRLTAADAGTCCLCFGCERHDRKQ